MVRVEQESYDPVKSNPSLGVAAEPTTAYLQFQFRFTPPFDNLKVRQAVEYAINRDEINRVVNEGLGEVASQPFPKNSPSYNPTIANEYPFDPAQARRLLAEAGHPNGVNIEMVIPGGNITNMERQGAIIQQELEAVGIHTTIKRILGSQIEAGYYLAREGNAFAAERPGDHYPPDQLYGQWGEFQFVAIYSSGERHDVTELATKALALGDTQQANDVAKDAVKLVMDQALDVPIAFVPQLIAYSKSRVGGTVHGQTDICEQPDLTGVTLK